MGTTWLALRAEVRRRWRALLALAVLLGLVGGAVLAAAAGARRTDTAYPRMLAWSHASQVEVVPQGTGRNGYYTALARLPQIESMGTGGLYQAVLPGARDNPEQLMASLDGNEGLRVDRVRVLAGRLYDPRAGRPGDDRPGHGHGRAPAAGQHRACRRGADQPGHRRA